MPPLRFSETLAHSGDPLYLHLERVSRRGANSLAGAVAPEAGIIARVSGLFHDVGKATPFFQEYLETKKRTGLTPHAKCGAVISWWYSRELGLPLWTRLAILVCVLRHHGALNFDAWRRVLERIRLDIDEDDVCLEKQLRSIDLSGLHEWLSALKNDGCEKPFFNLPAKAPCPEDILSKVLDRDAAPRRELKSPFSSIEESIIFLAGFGALLATDKTDTALEGAILHRELVPENAVNFYKRKHFDQAISDPLCKRREAIAAEVEQVWLSNINSYLFTLTSPTGSGKTLAILNAALRARFELERLQGIAPRIIYCLPFTSVIDQNHSVFKAVLKAAGVPDREDLLLKHHHLVEGVYRSRDAEHATDGAGQLLTETWQSEIVVTTFYQLLHSLLSAKNGNLKRAGQLSGSIVLMDEVQAVPLQYWQTLRRLFQAVASALGARFVLLTATRPLIFRPEDATELLPSHPEHFCALSRVNLFCHLDRTLTLEDFAKHIAAEASEAKVPTLLILNRKKAVKTIYELLRKKLPKRKIIALSTDFTPRDRRARIRLIQRLLRSGDSCIVVTTQLIEAGVDVSFPIVHRDLAPLDSVIQSAGRCNRHAAAEAHGQVHLWRLLAGQEGSTTPTWQRVYDSHLIEAATEVLSERNVWEERDFLFLSQQYFEACWKRQDQIDVAQLVLNGNFEAIEKSFQLIPDGPPTITVFISTSPKDEEIWLQYSEIQSDQELKPHEKEAAFKRIKHAFYERVVQVRGRADPYEPIIKIDQNEGGYCRETGFVALPEEPSSCIF